MVIKQKKHGSILIDNDRHHLQAANRIDCGSPGRMFQAPTNIAKGKGSSNEELMEAIWIPSEMRVGGAYAHSAIADPYGIISREFSGINRIRKVKPLGFLENKTKNMAPPLAPQ